MVFWVFWNFIFVRFSQKPSKNNSHNNLNDHFQTLTSDFILQCRYFLIALAYNCILNASCVLMFAVYSGVMDCWPYGEIVCQAQVSQSKTENNFQCVIDREFIWVMEVYFQFRFRIRLKCIISYLNIQVGASTHQSLRRGPNAVVAPCTILLT